MASAQRLLSRQLWLVGRCSLCRHLHTSPFELSQKVPWPFQSTSTKGRAEASYAQNERNETGRQRDRYQGSYQDRGLANEDEVIGSDQRREGRYSGSEEGGSKSFRGWGKFSKPSTWGTKTKRVWKSKQTPFSQDDYEESDELYPTPEPSQRRRRSTFDTSAPVTREERDSATQRESLPRGEELEAGRKRGEARRKALAFADVSEQRAAEVAAGGAGSRFGVRSHAPGAGDTEAQGHSPGAGDTEARGQTFGGQGSVPKRKDVIKKEYKRPGRIHTEEDRQPWVKDQPRSEYPQQVYGGLRRQVSDPEGGPEDEEGPSAGRDLQWGQQIDFKVYQFTPLGMRVIIRGGYDGLVYNDQIDLYGRERIEIGDVMKGYVFKIRDDDKVDISLRAFGTTQYELDKTYLEEQLIIFGGFIPLTSKSSPQEITAKLQLTKNGFKKAVGGLMKIGRALETEEGIVLIEDDTRNSPAST